MKRTWIVIAAICAALGFTACSKPADNDEMTVPESVETSAVEEPGPGESTALASQEAPGNTAEFKILMAKVTEVSDTLKDVTVKNEIGLRWSCCGNLLRFGSWSRCFRDL